MLEQITCYGFFWIAFIAIAWRFASQWGAVGILLGHLVIAMMIGVMDLIWIKQEMARPGWDGSPDQDGIFMMGVLIRIVLVNLTLGPVSMVAFVIHRHRDETTSDL